MQFSDTRTADAKLAVAMFRPATMREPTADESPTPTQTNEGVPVTDAAASWNAFVTQQRATIARGRRGSVADADPDSIQARLLAMVKLSTQKCHV